MREAGEACSGTKSHEKQSGDANICEVSFIKLRLVEEFILKHR